MNASEGAGPSGRDGAEAEQRAARAEELDDLVFECLERIESEGPAALEALCHERPESAPALLERIRALLQRGLVDVGDEEARAPSARAIVAPADSGGGDDRPRFVRRVHGAEPD
jgi:hypothetical protein